MASLNERLAVKIAFLSLLTTYAEQRSVSKYISSLDNNRENKQETAAAQGRRSHEQAEENKESGSSRELSDKHELLVTQQLAFVSAYSKSPSDVVALTCHEIPTQKADIGDCSDTLSQRIVIHLAANIGNHLVLRKGLSSIADILQNESRNST